MNIKCTVLSIAVFAISISSFAQPRPGANPPASTQPSAGSTTATGSQSATAPTAGMPELINSELFIARADSSVFALMLDGQTIGSPAKYFNLTNLSPGYHRIQLTKPTVGKPMKGMSIAPEVLYDGYVNVPEGSRVSALNTGREQLNIVSIIPLIQYIMGILGQGNGQTGNGGIGQGTGNPWGLPWGWPPLGPQAMAGADFEMLKATIANKPFESSKMDVLRMAMVNNHFSSVQVAQLMNLMSFESTKLDLAKMLYSKVVDKGNFYLVNNAFDFSSSSSELAQYITGFAG
jgi:hypothetical protein